MSQNNPIIILPYLFESEVELIHNKLNNSYLEYISEPDVSRIGPDLMYQKLWKQTTKDIILLHSDMLPMPDDQENTWYDKLIQVASKYPEAGMISCKLLYPSLKDDKYLIQYAGGKFTNGIPDHYGSGLDLFTNKVTKHLETDEGQYDKLREVAWATFGGVFIRREVLDAIGDFDTNFEWSYNRDVDYCLTARKLGYKIIQTGIPLLHFESKDVKRIRTQEHIAKEQRNLQKLQNKWKDSPLYSTLNKEIE